MLTLRAVPSSDIYNLKRFQLQFHIQAEQFFKKGYISVSALGFGALFHNENLQEYSQLTLT